MKQSSQLEPDHEFFWLIERLYQDLGLDPEHEAGWGPIRYHADASISFAAAEIQSLTRQPDSPPELCVRFLGLHGSQSPLPGYYLDELAWEQLHQIETRIRFLDLFHHRCLFLLHRIWRQYRYYLRFRPGGTDPLSRHLLTLSGMVSPGPQTSGALSCEQRLANLPLVLTVSRPASLLIRQLKQLFGLIWVRVLPWQARNQPIPPRQQNRLGQRACQLAQDGLLGLCLQDRAGKFRLQLQSLTRAQFLQLLPGQTDYQRLCALMDFWLDQQLLWDLQLQMAPDEACQARLNDPAQTHLGFDAFLGQPPQIPELIRDGKP
jgi:type VI secretion system protein ImpH